MPYVTEKTTQALREAMENLDDAECDLSASVEAMDREIAEYQRCVKKLALAFSALVAAGGKVTS
jgi:exonuclease VII small subunit